MKSTWVVIPAFNEARSIPYVLKKVKRYAANIVVVDDGSKDRTAAAAEQGGAIVLRHIVNLGKGATLKTGCDYALEKGAKCIVVMDADGQHEPEEIPNFLKALGSVNIVLGYRTLTKMPAVLKAGNRFINMVTSALYGVNVRDSQCGYRAFTAKAYRKIRWNSTDYSMESEMIANMGRHRLSFTEIPIKTIYADEYKGTTVFDGIRIVVDMFLWRLRI
jgi:glycosyltransferase involved in cell wall biosynthesis